MALFAIKKVSYCCRHHMQTVVIINGKWQFNWFWCGLQMSNILEEFSGGTIFDIQLNRRFQGIFIWSRWFWLNPTWWNIFDKIMWHLTKNYRYLK